MTTTGDEDRLVAALDRLIQVELRALRREMEYTNVAVEKAATLATKESKERLEAHNGLIEQMRAQAAHYVTKEVTDLNYATNLRRFERLERWQSQMTGAMILITIVLPILTALLLHLLS
jgi:hypothetical protein